MFDSVGLRFIHIICESIELAFHDGVVPVQYSRQCGKRRIVRIVARDLANSSFSVSRSWNFKSLLMASRDSRRWRSSVRWYALIRNSTGYRLVRLEGEMLSLSHCERAFGVRERESIAVLIDDEEHVALVSRTRCRIISIAAHRPTRLRRCFNSLTQREPTASFNAWLFASARRFWCLHCR
jgi:hypothetical protein